MTTTHPTSAGTSQCSKILSRLRASSGQWVPMPELVAVSGGYACHSRISDLRKQDLMIDHKNERQPDGSIHSFYRLIEKREVAA